MKYIMSLIVIGLIGLLVSDLHTILIEQIEDANLRLVLVILFLVISVVSVLNLKRKADNNL